VENEKKLIFAINEKFTKRGEGLSKFFNYKDTLKYFEKQSQMYDSFLDRFDESSGRVDFAGMAMRKEIRKNAVKMFPEVKELLRLNTQQNDVLLDALHAGHVTNLVDQGLLADPELVISDYDYDEFEPPYPLMEEEINVDGDFDQDGSFSWADWGTLSHYVRFKVNHGIWDSSWDAYKYASTHVGLGINYRMPKHGALDITIVLKNFDNHVTYAVTDNFGFSDANFDLENMIFIPVSSGGVRKYLHAVSMIHERRNTSGNNISDSIRPLATNSPFIINFRTDHIHEGEDIQVMVASWLRIYSRVNQMKTDISVSLLWKVDKIYLRVVE
jgi:hypothetical protein